MAFTVAHYPNDDAFKREYVNLSSALDAAKQLSHRDNVTYLVKSGSGDTVSVWRAGTRVENHTQWTVYTNERAREVWIAGYPGYAWWATVVRERPRYRWSIGHVAPETLATHRTLWSRMTGTAPTLAEAQQAAADAIDAAEARLGPRRRPGRPRKVGDAIAS